MNFKTISNYDYLDKSTFEPNSDKPSEVDSSFYRSVEDVFKDYIVEGKLPVPDYAFDSGDDDVCDDDSDFDSTVPNSVSLSDIYDADELLTAYQRSASERPSAAAAGQSVKAGQQAADQTDSASALKE